MRPYRNKPRQGLSLVEVIATVGIIGILAAIAVPNLGQVLTGSKRGVAANTVETLNKATKKFNHSQWDLRTTPVPNSGADELLILRTLQWRDPNPSGELNASGPFMKPDWNPVASTNVQDYRAEWNGASWRLLEPGTPGGGLRIAFDGSDFGTPFVHPPGFQPVTSH